MSDLGKPVLFQQRFEDKLINVVCSKCGTQLPSVDYQLAVINDPTFPAIIIDINVGANSKITDCLVAKPIKDFDKNGLLKFRAVWIEITAPIKKDKIIIIGKDSIIKSLISLKINFLKTLNLQGLKNDILIIIKYLPMSFK